MITVFWKKPLIIQCLWLLEKLRLCMGIDHWLKHFDLKMSFTFLKITEFPQRTLFYVLYLSIFVIFKIKKN